MTTTVTDLLCNHFGGIRRVNARFSADQITCSDCQNVELFNTEMNSGVGIRTSKGNTAVCSLFDEGEQILGIWESVQNSSTYCFIYTENDGSTSGKFYAYTPLTNTLTVKKTGLTKTGKCSGTDFARGVSDLFVFSNGTEMFDIQIGAQPEIIDIDGNDADGNPVKGLGLKVYDNRLWVFHDNKVLYSYQGDDRDFATHDADNALSAGVIDFTKNLTAIMPYLDSLAVFFKDSSCLISGTYPYAKTDESPGGCASYNALVFHGTELWFYDDTKKGVFSFKQVVTGDKTLGQNVAIDIQEELLSIDKGALDDIKALSVVLDDRNEIWFLIPTHYKDKSTIMIFDYIHGEWVKRICQPINCFNIVDNVLYSGTESKLLVEYVGDTFDGEFIENKYICSTANFGVDNALKIFYFPPRATLDMSNYSNNFYVKYIRNYDYTKNKKEKYINGKGLKRTLIYDSGMNYDSGYIYPPKKYSSIVKFPSSTFKTLEIQIYTKQKGEDFAINNFECSKVKIKQV